VVTVEHTRHRREDRAVFSLEVRMRDLAPQNRELMAQHENLGVLGPVSAATQDQQVEDETVEAGHGRA